MTKIVEGLGFIYRSQGQWIRGTDGNVIGKGLFESDLVDQGFSKSLLRRLVEHNVLKRVTTKFKGGWRNTYVLPMPIPEGYDLDAPQTEKIQS